MIECGDLALDRSYEYGILLMGKTKAGKTTSAHYLTHQLLIGDQKDGGKPFYRVQNCRSDLKSAKIGQTQDSETQIPN